MAGGTRFLPFTQFNAQAVSGTTTYNSPSTDINQLHNCGIDLTFVGTMTGTITVNCCNDNLNFKPLSFDPPLTQPSGSNLSFLVDLNQVPFRYLRVSYTNASGSGTLTSLLTCKDLG